MLIRISLIIAIVAGLAAAGIGFLKVREKIVTTMAERDEEAKQKTAAQKELASTKKTLKTTQEDLVTTQKTLTTTKKELETQTARAETLDKQKTDLTSQLTSAKADRDAAQQKLIVWEFIGSPEQMKAALEDLKTTRQQRDTFVAENKILARDNAKLNAKIKELIGDDETVALPVGLKGKVLAVDPKYDFVVLDIGGDQGVLERGVMLVNRRGVLVGKIKIASVSPQRSVANILPDSKNPALEVMEGDQVLY